MTNTMGVSEAKAMSPNPSIMGFRPRIEEASPTPRAVTSGTVMVDVVTAKGLGEVAGKIAEEIR